MTYLLMVSHGKGMRYIMGGEIPSIDKAEARAKDMAKALNERKSPRAPKVTVTVLGIVSEYNHGGKVVLPIDGLPRD